MLAPALSLQRSAGGLPTAHGSPGLQLAHVEGKRSEWLGEALTGIPVTPARDAARKL